MRSLATLLLCLGLLTPALAKAEELNTGVLPALWYSKTQIYDGDDIKIYGGIQNHSDVKFSGTAVFYINGREIGRSPFVSEPDTLIEVETGWKALIGDHDARLAILDLAPSTQDVWSSDTGEIKLKVTREVTPELVKETAEKATNALVGKIDETTENLAQKVDNYREERANKPKPELDEGSVLGTSTQSFIGATFGSPVVASAFDLVLKFLSALLRHWPWTLGGALLLFLMLKMMGRR